MFTAIWLRWCACLLIYKNHITHIIVYGPIPSTYLIVVGSEKNRTGGEKLDVSISILQDRIIGVSDEYTFRNVEFLTTGSSQNEQLLQLLRDCGATTNLTPHVLPPLQITTITVIYKAPLLKDSKRWNDDRWAMIDKQSYVWIMRPISVIAPCLGFTRWCGAICSQPSQKHRGKPLLLTISVLGSCTCITQYTASNPTYSKYSCRNRKSAIRIKINWRKFPVKKRKTFLNSCVIKLVFKTTCYYILIWTL